MLAAMEAIMQGFCTAHGRGEPGWSLIHSFRLHTRRRNSAVRNSGFFGIRDEGAITNLMHDCPP